MNDFHIACPKCRTSYRARVENVGRKAKCAKCGDVFIIIQPTQPEQERPATRGETLTACRFCGFQDSGNFCSNCGGRLTARPPYDFEACKIPQTFLCRFPRNLTYSLDAPGRVQEENQRLYEVRQHCENYNRQVEELERFMRYGEGEEARWQFSRLRIGQMVDSIPPDLAERESIVTRLWTIVSDVERPARKAYVDDLVREAKEAIELQDVKKAQRVLSSLKSEEGVLLDAAMAAQVKAFEEACGSLCSVRTSDKERAAFAKIVEKADKLAFQQEAKKALKAYQECLFWLSRHELPEKATLQADVEEKLKRVQDALSQQ